MGKYATMYAQRPADSGLGQMIIGGFFNEYMKNRDRDELERREQVATEARRMDLESANMPGKPISNTLDNQGIMLPQSGTGGGIVGPAGTGSFDQTANAIQKANRYARSNDPEVRKMGLSTLQSIASGKASGATQEKWTSSDRMYRDKDGKLVRLSESNFGNQKVVPYDVAQKVISDDIGGSTFLRGQYEIEPKDSYVHSLKPGERPEVKFEQARQSALGKHKAELEIEKPIIQFAQRKKAFSTKNLISEMAAAKDQVDWSNTGIVAQMTDWLGSTPATDMKSKVEYIKANLGIDALLALKASSSTGASGLGQLSQKELDVITSTVANLDRYTSPEEFKRKLDVITEALENFEAYENQFQKVKHDVEGATFDENTRWKQKEGTHGRDKSHWVDTWREVWK